MTMEYFEGHNTRRMSRSERLRVHNVRLALTGLIVERETTPIAVVDALLQEPVDNSTRIPGAIGSVLLPHEYHASESFQIVIEDDAGFGFDSDGNYHCSSLRTEHIVDL